MTTINGLRKKQQKFWDKVIDDKADPELSWERDVPGTYYRMSFSFTNKGKRYTFMVDGHDVRQDDLVKLARKAFGG